MDTTVTNGYAYGTVASISPSGSPFTWTNPESVAVLVCISGGTVTTIDVSPDNGGTFVTLGLLGGAYRLNPGHQIKVTYVVAPTMRYWPN